MIYCLYCLYDKVANFYHAPSAFQNDELCMRDLSFLVNHDERLKAAASDYEVIFVGTFDSESGVIEYFDHRIICRLDSLLKE